MKNQALFSSKDKSKKSSSCLLQFLFGTLRVNVSIIIKYNYNDKYKFNDKCKYMYNINVNMIDRV